MILTKILIIAGSSLAVVISLFVLGRILDKSSTQEVEDNPKTDSDK